MTQLDEAHAPSSPQERKDAQFVRDSIFHIFTDLELLQKEFPDAYPRTIVRGSGVYLYDDHGVKLLDCAHSLGANAVGHGREVIAERIYEQTKTLEYCSLEGGLTHPRVAELAKRLAGMVPVDRPSFYFSSTGSEAVENAIKLARGYHKRNGEPGRTKFIVRNASYHGATMGAMAATGNPMVREPFGPMPAGFIRATHPSAGRCGYCELSTGCTLGCANDIERMIAQEGPDTVAAVLTEPISVNQGVTVPDQRYWARVSEICRENGILLIIDEVVTGFGRTGKMFASEHWGIRPDILTLAKGITSAYFPVGATVVSEKVQNVYHGKVLPHANTYSGHPVGAVAAMANIDILESEKLVEHAAEMESILGEELSKLKAENPEVFRTTAIGLLGSAEYPVKSFAEGAKIARLIRHEAMQENVVIRCANDGKVGAIIFYPPLVINADEIRQAFEVIRRVYRRVREHVSMEAS